MQSSPSYKFTSACRNCGKQKMIKTAVSVDDDHLYASGAKCHKCKSVLPAFTIKQYAFRGTWQPTQDS